MYLFGLLGLLFGGLLAMSVFWLGGSTAVLIVSIAILAGLYCLVAIATLLLAGPHHGELGVHQEAARRRA